jgi:hypothetical protein
METTKLMGKATIAAAAVVFVAILGTSFLLAPLAIASSSGSDNLNLIEIMRAQTHYKTGIAYATSASLSVVPASPSPDVALIRMSYGLSGTAQMTLLQEAGDI